MSCLGNRIYPMRLYLYMYIVPLIIPLFMYVGIHTASNTWGLSIRLLWNTMFTHWKIQEGRGENKWWYHKSGQNMRLLQNLERAWERGYTQAGCLHTGRRNKQRDTEGLKNIKLKFMRCIEGHNGWPKHPWERTRLPNTCLKYTSCNNNWPLWGDMRRQHGLIPRLLAPQL